MHCVFIAQKKIAVPWIFLMPRITVESFQVQTVFFHLAVLILWSGTIIDERGTMSLPDGDRNHTKEDVIYILSKWAPFLIYTALNIVIKSF